jgi:hypothetical protein
MLAKTLTLLLAAGALVSAVIYAQNKAEKTQKVKPVFESSKSGTPTPWPDDKESPTSPKKKVEKKGEEDKPAVQEKKEPEKKPEATEKDKEKKIMPSSKSMVPGAPAKKLPPPPT